jgi:hypothetical protein
MALVDFGFEKKFSFKQTLQEWGKKPTAEPYADGQMSLPSA